MLTLDVKHNKSSYSLV